MLSQGEKCDAAVHFRNLQQHFSHLGKPIQTYHVGVSSQLSSRNLLRPRHCVSGPQPRHSAGLSALPSNMGSVDRETDRFQEDRGPLRAWELIPFAALFSRGHLLQPAKR